MLFRSEKVRYCGTPFKYSVSEEYHTKAIAAVTVSGKNEPVKIERIPLFGLQDVRREKGSLNDVLSRATEENKDDFVSVTLTDEKEIYNFREKLEEVYSHILEIKIENERTRKELEDDGEEIRLLSPLEAFDGFYQTVRCCPMSEEEKKIMEQIIAQWETEAE